MIKRNVAQFVKKTLTREGRAEIYADAKLNFNKIQSIYQNPRRNFSELDNYLRKLRRPLYFYIMAANVGVFLAWQLRFPGEDFLFNHFALSTMNIDHYRYHTLLTYSFSHIQLFHFLFDTATIYFLGRMVENYFGSRALLTLWLAGAVTAGVFTNSANAEVGNYAPTMGGWGAIHTILAFCTLSFPHQKVNLFFGPTKFWVIGVALMSISLIGSSRSAAAGEIGGLLAGAGYFMHRRGWRF